MREPRQALARQWIDRAENDLLNVANNIGAPQVPWDTVCFHCQQAAEKYLKMVLVILDEEIPRIHDLELLLDLVKEQLPELLRDREELRWLATCSISSRYPVEVMEAPQGKPEGARAQVIALRVRDSCRSYAEAAVPGLLEDSGGTPGALP